VILEVVCCFDMHMDLCFSDLFLKYQPLINALTVGGYSTTLVVLNYGSLRHVHRLCFRGLQIAGHNKINSKQIAKYFSVSAIIGSLHIGRRRCHLYP
jgi:hypothetical protein